MPAGALLSTMISPASSISGESAYLSVTNPTTQLSFSFPSTFPLARSQYPVLWFLVGLGCLR